MVLVPDQGQEKTDVPAQASRQRQREHAFPLPFSCLWALSELRNLHPIGEGILLCLVHQFKGKSLPEHPYKDT